MLSAVTASALLLAAACAGGGDSTSTSGSGSYGISGVLELSGPTGSLGTAAQQGAQFYFDQVNASGGVGGHKITFKSIDTQSDPTKAVAAYRSLISDKSVVGVLGPQMPDAGRLVAKLTESAKLPLVSFLLSVTDDEFNANKHWFRMGYSASGTMQAGLEMLKKKGDSKVAVVYADDAGGQAGMQAAKSLASAAGVSIVATVPYPDNVTDPTAQILRAKQSGAQAYVVWDSVEVSRLALVTKTMRANGITAPLYEPEAASLSDFVKNAGPVSDVYFWSSFSPSNPSTDGQKAFATDWQKKYNAQPTDFNSAGYALAQIYVAGIKKLTDEKKPVTRENLRDAIEGLTDQDTVYGSVSYTAGNHGKPFPSVAILRYANGVSKPAA